MASRELHRSATRRVRFGVVLLVLCVGLLFACRKWLFLLYSPGGVPPMYAAVDHDWYLTWRARSASAVIAALERYRREDGVYPADVRGLTSYLPSCRDEHEPNAICGWGYCSRGAGYSLALRLGWDPDLRYEFDGKAGQWVFDPGDGSDEKPIVLEP